MAKSKPKWLAEATTRELVVLLKECIAEEDTRKVDRIIAELLERIPEDDGNLTVEDAIKKASECLEDIQKAYEQEAKEAAEEPEAEEEEEEEAPPKKRTRKSRKSKKEPEPEPEEEDEDEEDDEDEDEDEEDSDYEDMSQGDLKRELRRRGIKVTRSMKKADMIRALEADDEE